MRSALYKQFKFSAQYRNKNHSELLQKLY